MPLEGLEAYLEKSGVKVRFWTFKSHTMTVDDAERQLGVSRENIVKSIVFVDEDDAPILAIVPGDRKVSRDKLAGACGVNRVRIAGSLEVEELTGYEAGAIPPVGHEKPLRTLMDSRVLTLERVFGGGGALNVLLEMDPRDIKRLVNAGVADISEV